MKQIYIYIYINYTVHIKNWKIFEIIIKRNKLYGGLFS
jgi:hypothetical protein